jgi:ABC-type glycerol-3-phosphate transport system permease component
MKKGYSKKDIGTRITVVVLCTLLIVCCLFVLIPLIWGLSTSLKSKLDFLRVGNDNVLGFPTLDKNNKFNSFDAFFKLENYVNVFNEMSFTIKGGAYYSRGQRIPATQKIEVGLLDLLFNSIVFCVVGAGLKTIVPAVCAFICAKYKFKWVKIVPALVIFNMTVPVVGTLPSELQLLRDMGIYDTWFMHAFQSASFDGTYFLVFLATYAGLSDAYIEAAEIDGASQLRVLISIALPLTIKIISTIFLLNFISYWNNYTSPLIYLPTHPTLAWGAFQLDKDSQIPELNSVPGKVSASMFLAMPVLILFLFLREKIMGNVSMGGIKE